MLSGIARAIMIAFYPNPTNIDNDHIWYDQIYSIKDSLNIYCTIAFSYKFCVAIFRDKNSKRTLSSEYEDPKEYFKGTLNIIKGIAEDCLRDWYSSNNEINIPKVTTAFWGYRNTIFSVDTYEDIMQNGGKIIKNLILPYEETLEILKKKYNMTDDQINLLQEIYLRKMQRPNDIIILTEKERNMIDSSNNIEGMVRSKFSFRKIGVNWA